MTERETERAVCCETICENISAMHDGESLTISSVDLTVHLHECVACRKFQVNLPKLMNKMRNVDRVTCDVDLLWNKVVNDIENDLVSKKGGRFNTESGESIWPSKRLRQWLASVSLAASVIIGVVTGSVLLTMPEEMQPTTVVTEIMQDFARFQRQGNVLDVTEQNGNASISWLAGKVDFDLSAAVKTPLGYETAGVRLCSLSGRKMAFIQYKSDWLEALSLYVMKSGKNDPLPAGPRLTGQTTDGLNTLVWKKGDLAYVAISRLSLEKIDSLLGVTTFDTSAMLDL